jgi:hypothetical protein
MRKGQLRVDITGRKVGGWAIKEGRKRGGQI